MIKIGLLYEMKYKISMFRLIIIRKKIFNDFMALKIKIHNQHNSNYLIIYIEREI